ncbi:Ig-like domain-containing protein [candidate division KSB1 bacterium]|nr:Ig-like domain-containing protein [candidate division KSB1 bacterium]
MNTINIFPARTRFIFSVWFLLCLSCAKQGFPPGGPEDKTPPRILETNPKSDTTNVSTDTQIEITFSESIERTSCEESIFITPFAQDLRYKWRRRKLRIIFPDGLIDDRTYVVTIGAGAKDERNNAMKESFSFAFSTGDSLDRGVIEGRVFDDGPVSGILMWAYDLQQEAEPNPAVHVPLYVTQVGENGGFRLPNMATGRYRVFAVNDREKNSLYDVEYDALGVASRDVVLAPNALKVTGLNMRIAVRDTTAPDINAAVAPDRRHVDIRFSEPLWTENLAEIRNYRIYSPDQGDSLDVMAAWPDIRNSAYVHLATSEQEPEREYILSVNNLRDPAGHFPAPDSAFVRFTGSPEPDTTGAEFLLMIPADSSNFILLNQPFDIFFSDAMDTLSVNRHIRLADTTNRALTVSAKWNNRTHLTLTPLKNYTPETLYFISFPVDSVFDLCGNSFADTLFQKRFLTVNPDTLTSISGTVTDTDTTAKGPFFLYAGTTKGTVYTTKAQNSTEYRFDSIMPGTYTIHMFRDEDENGRYSFGEAFPYVPSERYFLYPDSVKVRSRWFDEGEDIVFPE